LFFKLGFNNGKFTIATEAPRVGVDLQIVRANIGLNAKHSFLPDPKFEALGMRVLHTEFGEFRYFPRINLQTNTVDPQGSKGYMNLTNPGEWLNEVINYALKAIFKGEKPERYSAVVIYSLRQKQAMVEALTNTDPNFEYWVERHGATQKIFRRNLMTSQTALLSEADMYYPKADREKNGGMETETFLRKSNAWMESDGLQRISGMLDLQRSVNYLQALNNFGCEIDLRTRQIYPYASIQEIPTGVQISHLPEATRDKFTFKNGTLVELAPEQLRLVRFNPANGRMIVPGLKAAYFDHLFNTLPVGSTIPL
jgi:hypothetical protein